MWNLAITFQLLISACSIFLTISYRAFLKDPNILLCLPGNDKRDSSEFKRHFNQICFSCFFTNIANPTFRNYQGFVQQRWSLGGWEVVVTPKYCPDWISSIQDLGLYFHYWNGTTRWPLWLYKFQVRHNRSRSTSCSDHASGNSCQSNHSPPHTCVRRPRRPSTQVRRRRAPLISWWTPWLAPRLQYTSDEFGCACCRPKDPCMLHLQDSLFVTWLLWSETHQSVSVCVHVSHSWWYPIILCALASIKLQQTMGGKKDKD